MAGSALARGLAKPHCLPRAASWLAGCLAAALLSACGGGGGSAPPTQVLSIAGTVRSAANGQALAGVQVAAAGVSTTTAADGSYSLSSVPWSEPVAVRFDLAGHARGVASVVAQPDSSASADARLVPVGTRQTLDPTVASSVVMANSPAQVNLPAGGLVNATTGAPVSGPVTAELTVFDPAQDPTSMPGNYTAAPATAGGATRTIESFGAINVSLTDSSGNALNLARGQQATIRIPVSTRSADLPATIPLFYFNESTGLWVEEGSAVLAGTAPNQYYEGTVTHFSTWNADRPMETIFVNGCLRNVADLPVAGVPVTSTGVDYSGTASDFSNAQGQFRVAMRRGGVASIRAHVGDRMTNVVQVGPSQTDIDLSPCLVLAGIPQPPVILVPPFNTGALPGGFAVFTVQAEGTGVLRYQWLRDGQALAGATGSALVLTDVQASDDGARFSVQVSNDVGSTTSTAATLSVDTTPQPPVLLQQPQDASAVVGGSATFQVRAQSQGGQLSYQWQRNGQDITGATGTSHTTAAVSAGDDGALYSVLVRSDNGTFVLSDSARLSVVAAATPPTITLAPVSVSVGVGQRASFSVSADGSPTLLYQWRRNGTDIAGATEPGYTTPATTLADSGAVFSVVVRNGAGSATSAGATLTVTQPTGEGGYYLVSSGGPFVQATVNFADGPQLVLSQAILAVSANNPSATPVTLAPAGQTGQLALQLLQATIAGNTVSAARSRFSVYFSEGRLYKVDQVVAGSNLPTPQLLGNITTGQVCYGISGGFESFDLDGDDLADPSRSWVLLRGPGADAVCGNDDDQQLALRLDMDGSTAPVVLNAQPQATIRAANGAITGFVVRQGQRIQRTDASFGNPIDLFTASADFRNGPTALASVLPGVWFFRDGGNLKAVNLANPSTPQTLLPLNPGENPPFEAVGSGGNLYLALEPTFGTAHRLVRVTPSLSATVLATLSGRNFQLRATDTRLVYWSDTDVQSLPLAGGEVVTLFSQTPDQTITNVAAGASGVAIEVLQEAPDRLSFSNRLLLMNGDGSNPQTLENTSVVAGVSAASAELQHVLFRAHALLLAQGGVDGSNNAGATVRAMALDTRQTLQTYGSLPATPSGLLFGSQALPLQWGQPGLLQFMSTSTALPFTTTTDLYFLDTDAAGLIRATSFATGAGSAAPTATRVRAAGVLASPKTLTGLRSIGPGLKR